MAQDEQLDVLGRRRAVELYQPAKEPVEDQIEEAQRHVAVAVARAGDSARADALIVAATDPPAVHVGEQERTAGVHAQRPLLARRPRETWRPR